MARVFLSHSSKDKEFVRELFRRLTRDGVNCFFDEESIEWGTNFILSLEQGIDTCEFFVAVLSPDFVQSKWVELERTSAIADDPAGLGRKMRPLLLQPCELPRFLRQIQQFDVSTRVLFEKNYPKICAGLGGTVRADPELRSDRDTSCSDPVAIAQPDAADQLLGPVRRRDEGLPTVHASTAPHAAQDLGQPRLRRPDASRTAVPAASLHRTPYIPELRIVAQGRW